MLGKFIFAILLLLSAWLQVSESKTCLLVVQQAISLKLAPLLYNDEILCQEEDAEESAEEELHKKALESLQFSPFALSRVEAEGHVYQVALVDPFSLSFTAGGPISLGDESDIPESVLSGIAESMPIESDLFPTKGMELYSPPVLKSIAQSFVYFSHIERDDRFKFGQGDLIVLDLDNTLFNQEVDENIIILFDLNVPAILRIWKNRGATVIVLTARPDHTENRMWTYDSIYAAGIPLSFVENGDNVLFSPDKGDKIASWLKQTGMKPRRIAVFDDLQSNLVSYYDVLSEYYLNSEEKFEFCAFFCVAYQHFFTNRYQMFSSFEEIESAEIASDVLLVEALDLEDLELGLEPSWPTLKLSCRSAIVMLSISYMDEFLYPGSDEDEYDSYDRFSEFSEMTDLKCNSLDTTLEDGVVFYHNTFVEGVKALLSLNLGHTFTIVARSHTQAYLLESLRFNEKLKFRIFLVRE